jgi:hypothetical protein
MNTIMYYYNLTFPQKQIFCKTGSRSNTSVKWFTPVLDKMRNTLVPVFIVWQLKSNLGNCTQVLSFAQV